MNWKLLIFTFIPFAVIRLLIYFGIIPMDIGVILSLLSLFVPTLMDYSLKPKVALEIKQPQFIKKSFNQVNGYQLKSWVTNKKKKICLNLIPSLEIKDMNDKSPSLLYVGVDKIDGHIRKVESKEEPMRDIGYAWVDEKNEIKSKDKALKELRQDDVVGLLFPYQTSSVGVGAVGGPFTSYSSEYLLKLETNADYQVVMTVKGEDSEKNTVIKTKKIKIKIA